MAKLDKNYFQLEENIKQNTVEDILVEGESSLIELLPDRKTYILERIFKGLPIALLWGGIDGLIIYMVLNSGFQEEMGWYMILFLIGFFLIHLAPVWIYIANIVKTFVGYKNIRYVFTNKRIIIRSGVIGIDFKSIYYEEIQSINVKVGLLDRLFKVGDVHLRTSSQSAVLEDIKAPYHYSSKIQKVVQDIKTDINFPNSLRPKENPGYNTEYFLKD